MTLLRFTTVSMCSVGPCTGDQSKMESLVRLSKPIRHDYLYSVVTISYYACRPGLLVPKLLTRVVVFRTSPQATISDDDSDSPIAQSAAPPVSCCQNSPTRSYFHMHNILRWTLSLSHGSVLYIRFNSGWGSVGSHRCNGRRTQIDYCSRRLRQWPPRDAPPAAGPR
jgi:hypothetical protein